MFWGPRLAPFTGLTRAGPIGARERVADLFGLREWDLATLLFQFRVSSTFVRRVLKIDYIAGRHISFASTDCTLSQMLGKMSHLDAGESEGIWKCVE